MIFALQVIMGCTYGDMKEQEPDLALKKDIDLGLILDTTAPVELFIPIKNVSNRTITILKLSKDCSCISVTIDKRKLAPGETATLRYSANISGRTGRFASDIVIESDASEQLDEIQISGQITGQIRVRPKSVALLTGEKNSPGTFTVFSDDQGGKWNYTGFVSDNPNLNVELRSDSSSPTTSTYDGRITLSSDWLKSAKTSYCSTGVTLKFVNDRLGRSLDVNVPVEIAVRRQITMDPPSVTFLTKSGQQTRAILVQSVQPLAIDQVRSPSSSITAAIHRIDPKSLRVELVFQPSAVQGDLPANLACDLLSNGKTVGSVPVNLVQVP